MKARCPACDTGVSEGDAFCASCGSPLGPDSRAEIGILFVHGIGTQARGQTLNDFGEPLSKWVEHRCASQEPRSTRVRNVDTRKHDPRQADAPAHTTLLFEATGDDEQPPRERWLLAESWWAELITPPSYGELSKWSWSVLPWLLATHFGAQIRHSRSSRPREPDKPEAWWLRGWRWGLWCLGYLGAWGRLCVSMALTVLLVPLMFLFQILAMVPIPSVRAFLLGIQRGMSSVLGDSYVFLERPIEAAAIVGQVRRDLGWLAHRCKAVAIVAHSQGGSVAHEAVSDSVPGNVRLLFTFGSGLRKLEELRTKMQESTGHKLTAAAFLVATLFLVLVIGAHVETWIRGGALSWTVAHVVVVGLALAFVWGVVRAYTKGVELPEIKRKLDSLEARGIRWIDCYASADPVPNGEVIPEATGLSHEVHNRGSTIADHTTYWENRDEFISLLVDELCQSMRRDLPEASVVASLPLEQKTLKKIRSRREFRVLVDRATVFVGLVAVISAVAREWDAWWLMCVSIFLFLWGWLADLVHLEATAPRGGAIAWSAVGWFVLAILAREVPRWSWRSWNDEESIRAIEADTSTWGTPFSVVVSMWFALTFIYNVILGSQPPFWVFLLSMLLCALPVIIGSIATEDASAASKRPARAEPSKDNLIGILAPWLMPFVLGWCLGLAAWDGLTYLVDRVADGSIAGFRPGSVEAELAGVWVGGAALAVFAIARLRRGGKGTVTA